MPNNLGAHSCSGEESIIFQDNLRQDGVLKSKLEIGAFNQNFSIRQLQKDE